MKKSNKSAYQAGTMTILINEAKEKGRQTLHLVLKQKSLSRETLDNLNNEIEERLGLLIEKIIPKINEVNPKDPEKFLKYLTLQGVLKILGKIMEENYLCMTEEDKKAAEKIYEKCKEEDFKEDHENNHINKTKDNCGKKGGFK